MRSEFKDQLTRLRRAELTPAEEQSAKDRLLDGTEVARWEQQVVALAARQAGLGKSHS